MAGAAEKVVTSMMVYSNQDHTISKMMRFATQGLINTDPDG
jgi:hypothetical protein